MDLSKQMSSSKCLFTCTCGIFFSLIKSFCNYSLSSVCILLACENSCLSSFFVTKDVLRGITSATKEQKFHSDDVKSVRNPVRSADWSTTEIHCFSYYLQMTVKRQKATKVKCKCNESLTKQ